MIAVEKLKQVIEGYKKYFPVHWKDEDYKWEAIKTFRENWDIKAENFGEMFKRATSKTYNLLASGYMFPRKMIIDFAGVDNEAVRSMFINLFDENRDLAARIQEFQQSADEIRAKYDDGTWKNHYQNINAISTYLWLRFPEKYYIYKHEVVRDVAAELESEFQPKRNGAVSNVTDGYKMYDEIRDCIKNDNELVAMLEAELNNNDKLSSDPELKTLVVDICFYLSRFYLDERKAEQEDSTWFPKDYNPGFTVEEWVELLNDSSVFTAGALQIMKRIKDYGGQATCTQLSIKYGETKNFYNSGSSSLAKRVAEKTGCDVMTTENENIKWWPILYTGRDADSNEAGSYVWHLRAELAEALNKTDLSEVALYADSAPSIWKISHGTESTGVSDENKKIFLDRNVVAVDSLTKAKATSRITQGQSFMDEIRKGDYFYLCYGNSIRLLGQFTEDKPVANPEIGNGWFERSYRVIAESKDTSPYYGTKKWWTPNDNSTCIKVAENEQALFEKLILMPYFNMTVDSLSDKSEHKNYWWLNAKPQIWSYSDIKIGEEQSYTLYNENGNKRRIFQNFLDAKSGDIVIGYESAPVKKIVAIAEITQANDGENLFFVKKEVLSSPVDYVTLKELPELEKMEFFVNPNGSLFKLTKNEFDFIMDIIREENPIKSSSEAKEKYTKEDFLSKVFMDESRYNILEALLRNKKNIILQGAPGVGKTFAAKKLAYAMMGEIDDSRIEFVQFHQNYSYEDFIMGYRPDGEGFKLTDGIFYRFCKAAENNPDKDYFFIIDEINRGNMSKIFGELMMLIEKDYRGTKATLAYSGMPFSVPENLYIIGMMNTADRSLAMIDYALRRRFSFFEIEPGFNSDGFKNYLNSFGNETFNSLIKQIIELNADIYKDDSLGPGFRIGHSYFCGREGKECTDDWMRSVVEFDILPMLSEYWFDNKEKLQRWENNLRGVFND